MDSNRIVLVAESKEFLYGCLCIADFDYHARIFDSLDSACKFAGEIKLGHFANLEPMRGLILNFPDEW
jgi:hypothetical protein